MTPVRVPDAPSLLPMTRRWWPAALAGGRLDRVGAVACRHVRRRGWSSPPAWCRWRSVATMAARRAGTPWSAHVGRHGEWYAPRRGPALRARRPDGRRARHHHRRRDLLLAAPQPGLRSRSRRGARVRLPRAAGATEPLRADRTDALLAAALPGGRRGRRRRRARSAWCRAPTADPGGARPDAALRAGRPASARSRSARRTRLRAGDPAPRSRPRRRVHDHPAGVRCDARSSGTWSTRRR